MNEMTTPVSVGLPSRWVIAAPKKSLIVAMGDLLVSNDPSAQLVTYSLGSCVGISIYDPIAKVGGMLHAMLPDCNLNPERASTHPHMFVNSGLPVLFHAVYALGAMKQRLVVTLAGGAEFMDENKVFNIGIRNIETVIDLLNRNGVGLRAQDTGGFESRTMRLELSTGVVTLDTPGRTSVSVQSKSF